MSGKVYLVRHVGAEALEPLYRSTSQAIERSHLQIIWLLTCGHTATFVATVTGYSRRWISAILARYNADGVAGLGDRRRFNAGGKPLLTESQQESLRVSLADPPPGGGLWTGRTVAQWMAGLLGRLVAPRRATEYLHRLGLSRQVPRPRHAGADLGAQETFKATFGRRVQTRQHDEPGTPVEVWAFDEHRVGLKPMLRRVWARRGDRPMARGHQRFEWMYVFGFVRPSTGQVVWFLANAVNTALFNAVLTAFAREVGAGPSKRVMLVLDRAGWHIADSLEVPEGIKLEFLPPYSPELQPAERLWPLTNEPLANQHFDTLADLDDVLADHCCSLADDPDRIRAETLFHWWPAFA